MNLSEQTKQKGNKKIVDRINSVSHSNSGGMTLIEVLISLVILATVLLAMTSLMDIVQKQNWYNYRFTVASFLAQGKSEELQNLNFTAAALNDTGGWVTTAGIATGGWDVPESVGTTGAIDANGYYRRQWQITDNQPDPGKKRIDVRTQWTDRNNRVHTVSFKIVKSP